MAKQDLSWTNIDVDSLDQEHQDNYAQYKAAYALMKDAKANFENTMNAKAGLPKGKRLFFGYNFGKLSLAIGEDDAKPAAKGTPSLAQFLASQSASGVRV